MKNKTKTNVAARLLVFALVPLSGCTNFSNKAANEKLIKDYYTAYEKKTGR